MSYLGENIPKLGFGLMRLPMLGEEVDVEQVKEMVDLFLDAGFTYFDTAYGYIGGKSEKAIKEALVDRYPRDSFQLATKLPAWAGPKTAEEAQQMFYTSLERTGAGYFDFYLLHNLGDVRTGFYEDFGIWDFAKEKMAEGKIRHLGFSFHGTPPQLREILEKHPEAEFVQLQINYADWENPVIRSRECYEVAREFNKPVVIMEPVKGGMLASPPEAVAEIFRKADPSASLASWAIRFAASLDGVITVLSGMSSQEQMEDNLSYMEHFRKLSPEEQDVVKKAQEVLNSIPLIPCTNCNYCAKVCPQDIGISRIFNAMNLLTLYGNKTQAQRQYNNIRGIFRKSTAEECIHCGQCEDVCPQHILIRDELERGKELFG